MWSMWITYAFLYSAILVATAKYVAHLFHLCGIWYITIILKVIVASFSFHTEFVFLISRFSHLRASVDKAALVFSLKLDSGHKLLCPWIDNVCDEKLADFPPTATAMLVDQYKIRHSVLSQLAALPVISPKAVASLRRPQLEQFLRESLTVERDEPEFARTPQNEDTRNERTSISSLTYYQVWKENVNMSQQILLLVTHCRRMLTSTKLLLSLTQLDFSDLISTMARASA